MVKKVIPKKFSILIIEPIDIVRLGLKKLLKETFKNALIDEVKCSYVEELIWDRCPDLILMEIDYNGASNLNCIMDIHKKYPDANILIFTALNEDIYAIECFNRGALGFMPKNASLEEIQNASRMVAQGSFCFNKPVIESLFKLTKSGETKKRGFRLSPREYMVAEMLSNGDGVLSIANHLKLKIGTVSTYKVRLFKKLNVKNVIELARKIRVQ